jgi:hypothetical protein
LEVIEVGCRFDSGGAGTQHSPPDEGISKEMSFSISLQVNAQCLIKNFAIFLLEIDLTVKNLKKTLHCSNKDR